MGAAKLAGQRAGSRTVAQIGGQHPAEPTGGCRAWGDNDTGPQIAADLHCHAGIVQLQRGGVRTGEWQLHGMRTAEPGGLALPTSLSPLRNSKCHGSYVQSIYQSAGHDRMLRPGRAFVSFATLSRTEGVVFLGLSTTCMGAAVKLGGHGECIHHPYVRAGCQPQSQPSSSTNPQQSMAVTRHPTLVARTARRQPMSAARPELGAETGGAEGTPSITWVLSQLWKAAAVLGMAATCLLSCAATTVSRALQADEATGLVVAKGLGSPCVRPGSGHTFLRLSSSA